MKANFVRPSLNVTLGGSSLGASFGDSALSPFFTDSSLSSSLQSATLNTGFGTPIARSSTFSTDYELLDNKPRINSVTLEGNLTGHDLGLGNLYYDTKANWTAQTSLVSEYAAIYVYSDYATIYDDVGNPTYVAGVKIGDGTSYVVDLPFITDEMTSLLLQHIGNGAIHLTNAEREFWNNKISCYLDLSNAENLILSKTNYILED